MNTHDIDRIENALFILLQYKNDDNLRDIIKDSNIITSDYFFDVIKEIKKYF